MRRLLTATAAGAATLALAGPAHADDTVTTFTVTAGGLSLSVPASVNLGSGAAGNTLSGQIGPATVTDERASMTPAWTATVVASDFITGGGTPSETVAKANLSYWSGGATATSGTGTFTPGQGNAGAAQALGSPRTAFSHTGGSLDNSATWNPTLVVDVPSGVAAGLYTGTITHSVA